MNLGAILHLNGKLPEAEANYLRALQLKPDDVITQSNLRKLWNIMERQGLGIRLGLGMQKSGPWAESVPSQAATGLMLSTTPWTVVLVTDQSSMKTPLINTDVTFVKNDACLLNDALKSTS